MVNNQVRRRGGSTTTAIWITLATKACAGVGINSRTNVCQKRCCLLVALALFALGLSCRAVPRRASGPRARPPGKAGETWVALPGGRFVSHARSSGETVGERAPRPDRVSRVLLTLSAFAMLRTEVTVGQYRACVEAGRCSKPKKTARDDERNNWGSARSDTHPINGVDWAQAKAFCAWIGGRLPTAAEWEYAARSAGKDQRYPWGDQRADCTRAVMHGAKGKGCGRHGTWPVCSKNAGNSTQGLCDLTGNVWEWLADCHTGWADEHRRIRNCSKTGALKRKVRGGGWGSSQWLDPAFDGAGGPPDSAGAGLGFRCAKG
jgi:sulfatase modifying factor 1